MAVLSLMIGGWLFWRWPELNREISAVAARPQSGAVVPAVADAAIWMIEEEKQQSAADPELALAGHYVAVARRNPSPLRLHAALTLPPFNQQDPPDEIPAQTAVGVALSISQLSPREDPALADVAYALLASGQRRAAARKFSEALAAQPHDPRAAAWASQLRLMEKRWSGSAYVFARKSGLSAASAEPVLGGGQSGAQIAYGLNPLARQPLSLIARGSVANKDAESAQLAFGLKWHLLPGLSLSGERLAPAGSAARSAWNLRLAGGTYADHARTNGQTIEISTYAEAGIVGANRRDLYAAGTARIGRRLSLGTTGAVMPGLAIWGSVQHDDRTVARIEVGPSVQLRLSAPVALSLTGEYRQVITGNARPTSGPALTIAASF